MACGVYQGVLDRAEAVGFDVLGRGVTVRAWRLPAVALRAVRG
jgi:hypothetical protein